jgi:hypothetical protein
MFAVVIFELKIFPETLTERYLTVAALAVTLLLAERLLEEMLPVADTLPKVVVPPDPDCARVNHAAAFVSPVVGQISIVCAVVLYQSCP